MSSNRYQQAVLAPAISGAAVLELGNGNADASLRLGAKAPARLIERWRGALDPMLVQFAGVHDRNHLV